MDGPCIVVAIFEDVLGEVDVGWSSVTFSTGACVMGIRFRR